MSSSFHSAAFPPRLHREQIRILAPSGQAPDLLGIAHANRIALIETDDATVLDVDGRHAVAGGGHDERRLKADVEWTRRNGAVPVRPTLRPQSEMPLADDAGGVACLL
jgi:hypothetical protein